MSGSYSPLRYPGGKTKLYNVVKQILTSNGLLGGTYVEPFAGGAGLAIKLLLKKDVKRIILNDIDPAIFYFWTTILNKTEDFCQAIDQAELTVNEWQKQKDIFKQGFCGNEFEYAFAVFYLNRTNISGILSGGVIGGIEQKGSYKIDARFNKECLKKRIRSIAARKKDIILYNLDAKEFITGGYIRNYRKLFVNFDPPYVNKGTQLYKNSFNKNDHIELFNCISKCTKKWIVTYDVCDFIGNLYSKYHGALITVTYSAKSKTKKHEYMFFCKNLIIPDEIFCGGNNMKCTNECRFCSIQKGNKNFEVIDTPIIENDYYYLLSSIGALVEGWTLVIPKEHDYSMKKHYTNLHFYSFIDNCIRVIKKAYGVNKVIVFEHGANRFGSMTACGTNHSHIHIIPLNDSLLNEFSETVSVARMNFNQVENYVKDSEYLLYADIEDKFETSECYIHLLKEPVSQFFRQIIARKLGCPEKYNYREHNNIEMSCATVVTLQKEIENEKQGS